MPIPVYNENHPCGRCHNPCTTCNSTALPDLDLARLQLVLDVLKYQQVSSTLTSSSTTPETPVDFDEMPVCDRSHTCSICACTSNRAPVPWDHSYHGWRAVISKSLKHLIKDAEARLKAWVPVSGSSEAMERGVMVLFLEELIEGMNEENQRKLWDPAEAEEVNNLLGQVGVAEREEFSRPSRGSRRRRSGPRGRAIRGTSMRSTLHRRDEIRNRGVQTDNPSTSREATAEDERHSGPQEDIDYINRLIDGDGPDNPPSD